jgi:hypothetical protein
VRPYSALEAPEFSKRPGPYYSRRGASLCCPPSAERRSQCVAARPRAPPFGRLLLGRALSPARLLLAASAQQHAPVRLLLTTCFWAGPSHPCASFCKPVRSSTPPCASFGRLLLGWALSPVRLLLAASAQQHAPVRLPPPFGPGPVTRAPPFGSQCAAARPRAPPFGRLLLSPITAQAGPHEHRASPGGYREPPRGGAFFHSEARCPRASTGGLRGPPWPAQPRIPDLAAGGRNRTSLNPRLAPLF